MTDEALDRSARVKPDGLVSAWALLGLAWTIFAIWGAAGWIASGEARPVPIQGPDIYETWRLIGMRVLEISSMGLLAIGVLSWVILPWLKQRRLILEGMLLIGGCVGFFIDPLINNFHYTFAWNQHAINLGTWASAFPAWTPQGAYAEGILWAFPQYIMMSAGAAVAGHWIVARLRARFPGIGLAPALGIVFLIFFAGDFIVENMFLLFRVYAFARTHGAVTLFAGQLNQFPIYESLFVGAQAVPLTLLMLSARERADGLSFVERGADRIAAPYRTWARCFAIIGFTFVVYAFGYFFPSSWLSVTADSVIQLPSYLQPNPI
jgi:hypothetical protein